MVPIILRLQARAPCGAAAHQALVEVMAVPGFLAELAEEGEPSEQGEPAQYHRYPEKEKSAAAVHERHIRIAKQRFRQRAC